MPVHWTSEFRCRTCSTVITFDDEMPDWKPSERIARDMEAAQDLVGMVVPTHWMYGEPTPSDYLRYEPLKHVLRVGRKDGSAALHVLAVEFDNRCIDCPTCGAEVRTSLPEGAGDLNPGSVSGGIPGAPPSGPTGRPREPPGWTGHTGTGTIP